MLMWDVFISHASEDKQSVARPLAEELRKRGVRVWYDEFTLKVGDSLRRSIDEGLAKSKFGIVVLSRAFLAKEWPQIELDGLVARQSLGQKVILPVWHDISKEEVTRYSPTLADRLAANTSKGIPSVVDELLEVIAPDQDARGARIPTIRFLNDLWLEPLSIKVTVNSLVSGVDTVHVDWPESTEILIETVGSIAKDLEQYRQPTSRFHNLSPDWVAPAFEMGNGFFQYAKRMQQNVPVRIPILWKEMKGYWGSIINPFFEEALNSFLALTNLTIQLKLALFLHCNFPDKRPVISPHLNNWLDIRWAHPRQVFECLFRTDEPIFSAEILAVSKVHFHHYIFGPKSEVLEAYFDFKLMNRPIINKWFVKHLIPQIELIIAEGWNDLNCIVEYCEEAWINKIRDENDHEVRRDPRAKTASTDEPQRELDSRKPTSEELRSEALAEFREELQKQAARKRQIIGRLVPPPPLLTGFSLSVVENKRINDPKLIIEVENQTTKPMYGFEIWVNAIQFWSTAQGVFVSRSDLNRRVLLNAPKILEPDSPTQVFLLTKAGNGLLLIADRETKEVGGIWLKMPGIYRLELLIKTANPAQAGRDLFVTYEPDKVPRFISDPRLK
jgi:TIR domain